MLRNAGPQGGPGMPEWGMLPIPTKLVKQGVTRHAAPERRPHERHQLRRLPAALRARGLCGRPAGAGAQSGDRITVDVPARRIHLEIDDAELARRKAAWTPPPPRYERGYGWMFSRHILQADQGCDFDFLETGFGAPVAEPDIF